MTSEIETHVPDQDPPVNCPHCGRPFVDEHRRTLHEGIAHYEALDDERRAEFSEVYEAEQESIRLFRLKALVVLVVLYFGFLWAYSLVG